MPHELDKILIKYDQSDFVEQLTSVRAAVVSGTHLVGEKEQQLDAVLNEVVRRGDEAVAEFTEKFDGVKLTPEQFRISEAELKDTHKIIDKKLLKSIRQAIENVKRYQKEIYIGHNKKCSGGTEIK